jgi:hypothetical protein
MTIPHEHPALLVFVDGVLCDSRHRQAYAGTPRCNWPTMLLKDRPAPGAKACLETLAERFRLVYILARPPKALGPSCRWLAEQGFPGGLVLIGETIADRARTVTRAREEFGYEIVASIGTSETEAKILKRLGLTSLVGEEFAPNFGVVSKFFTGPAWGNSERRSPVSGCSTCQETLPDGAFARIDFLRLRGR